MLRVLPAPNGWYQNYHDSLVCTVVPDPFLLPSGPVEDGNVAVTYISRSSNKGAKCDEIPSRYIAAEPPTGKGKDFVMICGDSIRTIHTTKKALKDTKMVTKDSNFIRTMESKIFLHANACLLGDIMCEHVVVIVISFTITRQC